MLHEMYLGNFYVFTLMNTRLKVKT